MVVLKDKEEEVVYKVLEMVVDRPIQLTLVTWICQLSRRWGGSFLRGVKNVWSLPAEMVAEHHFFADWSP